MSNENNVRFTSGLLFGIVLGAIAGLFLAPQTGEETRQKLLETAEDFKKQISKVTEKLKEETNEVIEKGKSFLEEKREAKKKDNPEDSFPGDDKKEVY